MEIEVVHLAVDNPAVLYRRYPGRDFVQPCFVALDLADGALSADYDGEVSGNTPESVYHGRVLRWEIPVLTAQAANELLDDLAAAAQRVLDGASIEWNGSSNVVRLTAEALAAEEEATALCAAADRAKVVEFGAEHWFSEGRPPAVEAIATDVELEESAQELQADAQSQAVTDDSGDYIVLGGLVDYLAARRAQAREEVEEQLEAAAQTLTEITRRRDTLVRAASMWLSSRQVGDLACLSHTHVQRIVRYEQNAD
jgi:hypothetical protein